jgi:hypothetical protein
MIRADVPLDYYESSMPSITGVIAAGQNPYTRDFQPALMSVYPPLYNIFVAPLTWVFGNTLGVHRGVAGLFIILSCLVCFLAALKRTRSSVNSLAVAVLLYAGLLYYATPIASPNSTGLFFFLLSITIPWHYGFSSRSLAMGLFCGLLAFYSKQYFVAGLAFVCLYLFLAVSIKRAIAFGVLVLVGVLSSLVIIHITSPYYLDNTIFCVRTAAGIASSSKRMIAQLIFFLKIYSGLLLLLMLTGGYLLWKRYRDPEGGRTHTPGFAINIKALDQPLISAPPDYFWFCFLCATLVIVVSLGHNQGNYMTYLFQLMSPFLLIAGFAFLVESGCHHIILLPFVFFCFLQTHSILPKDFSIRPDHRANWDRLVQMIKVSDHVYTSPILLMPVIEGGKKIYANGHARYFSFSKNKPGFLRKGSEAERVSAIWQKHMRDLYRHIETQHFDLILLDRWTRIPDPPKGMSVAVKGKAHLKAYYEHRETVPVSLVQRPGGGKHAVRVWRPKRSRAKE